MKTDKLSSQVLMDIISMQTEVVQQGLDLSSIMDLVTVRTQDITNADGACIELIEKDELVYNAVSGMVGKYLGLRLNIGNSLSGECIKTRLPLISNDIELDARVNKEACRQIGLNSMIVVPLICKEDVVGVLKVLSAKADHFNEESVKILEIMSGLIAAAMFNAISTAESELFYKATHDNLTGLSNRSLFYDRLRQKLSQALRQHENFGIIALDMDGLKDINDNYGHRSGDAAIREVAVRINSRLREMDTVSRLGGDEFGILVGGVVARNELRELIRRIDNEITKPFEFEGRQLNLRASIGYALFSEDGLELEDLIEKADKSMYEEKRARKGGNIR